MERYSPLTSPAFILLTTLLIAACHPKELDDFNPMSNSCGQEGNRISAVVDGDSWCANASVTAIVSDDQAAILTGVGLTGAAITVQVDSIAYGDHPINEADNAVLWMGGGQNFTPRNDHPGILTILSHDPAARRLCARVTVTLFSETSGQQREVVADLDVTYAQE
ncbi:MAG: hypothetical protein JNM31_02760 [Flavobacteriales bacterium]|nr:hypothetical protein [Flavobacteriales bacterium]